MKEKINNSGAIALMLVIIITTLTLVSSVVIALVNTSNITANYHVSEGEVAIVDMDVCVEDALRRITLKPNTNGTFISNVSNSYCHYEISNAVNNIKTVTATASTTAELGAWQKTVVLTINVSSTPLWIESYHDAPIYDSLAAQTTVCGDWVCNGSEDSSSCPADCGPVGYCGDSVCNNSETLCSCANDCGSTTCGDGCCGGDEACDTCEADCGACPGGCEGYEYDGYCWFEGAVQNETCDTICAANSMTCSSDSWNDDASCTIAKTIEGGGTCSACYGSVGDHVPGWLTLAPHICLYNTGSQACSASSVNFARLCACE